jgi:hypothetical protein
MVKQVGAVIGGVLVWILVASLLNRAMRMGWPAYALVEKTYAWSLGMQLSRLIVGALSSLAAGYVAARIAPGTRAPLMTGIVMFALSLPIHIMEFDKMPLWYHAAFLFTLVPLVVLGGRLSIGRTDA